MVVKVYISGLSASKEVKKRQQRVLMILDSKHIQYEVIDITEPTQDQEKLFMQENSTKDGSTISDPTPRHPLPPQLFNDQEYCGDYEDFDMANEIDTLEVFLKVEAPKEPEPAKPDDENKENKTESNEMAGESNEVREKSEVMEGEKIQKEAGNEDKEKEQGESDETVKKEETADQEGKSEEKAESLADQKDVIVDQGEVGNQETDKKAENEAKDGTKLDKAEKSEVKIDHERETEAETEEKGGENVVEEEKKAIDSEVDLKDEAKEGPVIAEIGQAGIVQKGEDKVEKGPTESEEEVKIIQKDEKKVDKLIDAKIAQKDEKEVDKVIEVPLKIESKEVEGNPPMTEKGQTELEVVLEGEVAKIVQKDEEKVEKVSSEKTEIVQKDDKEVDKVINAKIVQKDEEKVKNVSSDEAKIVQKDEMEVDKVIDTKIDQKDEEKVEKVSSEEAEIIQKDEKEVDKVSDTKIDQKDEEKVENVSFDEAKTVQKDKKEVENVIDAKIVQKEVDKVIGAEVTLKIEPKEIEKNTPIIEKDQIELGESKKEAEIIQKDEEKVENISSEEPKIVQKDEMKVDNAIDAEVSLKIELEEAKSVTEKGQIETGVYQESLLENKKDEAVKSEIKNNPQMENKLKSESEMVINEAQEIVQKDKSDGQIDAKKSQENLNEETKEVSEPQEVKESEPEVKIIQESQSAPAKIQIDQKEPEQGSEIVQKAEPECEGKQATEIVEEILAEPKVVKDIQSEPKKIEKETETHQAKQESNVLSEANIVSGTKSQSEVDQIDQKDPIFEAQNFKMDQESQLESKVGQKDDQEPKHESQQALKTEVKVAEIGLIEPEKSSNDNEERKFEQNLEITKEAVNNAPESGGKKTGEAQITETRDAVESVKNNKNTEITDLVIKSNVENKIEMEIKEPENMSILENASPQELAKYLSTDSVTFLGKTSEEEPKKDDKMVKNIVIPEKVETAPSSPKIEEQIPKLSVAAKKDQPIDNSNENNSIEPEVLSELQTEIEAEPQITSEVIMVEDQQDAEEAQKSERVFEENVKEDEIMEATEDGKVLESDDVMIAAEQEE